MDIQYKGYRGKILYTAETGIFYGEVSNCAALVVFQGLTLIETEKMMHLAVDNYLQHQVSIDLV